MLILTPSLLPCTLPQSPIRYMKNPILLARPLASAVFFWRQLNLLAHWLVLVTKSLLINVNTFLQAFCSPFSLVDCGWLHSYFLKLKKSIDSQSTLVGPGRRLLSYIAGLTSSFTEPHFYCLTNSGRRLMDPFALIAAPAAGWQLQHGGSSWGQRPSPTPRTQLCRWGSRSRFWG